jgi:hypothetical protein
MVDQGDASPGAFMRALRPKSAVFGAEISAQVASIAKNHALVRLHALDGRHRQGGGGERRWSMPSNARAARICPPMVTSEPSSLRFELSAVGV